MGRGGGGHEHMLECTHAIDVLYRYFYLEHTITTKPCSKFKKGAETFVFAQFVKVSKIVAKTPRVSNTPLVRVTTSTKSAFRIERIHSPTLKILPDLHILSFLPNP